MKNLIRMEEASMMALSIYLNSLLPYPGWLFWALFLTPDISFVGYVFGARVGATTYNLFHHKGIAVALYLSGLYFSSPELQFAGVLLFGHSSFDRLVGYGLKYPDSFHNTHLGTIGKSRQV